MLKIIKSVFLSAILTLSIHGVLFADRYGLGMGPEELASFFSAIPYDVVQLATAPITAVSSSKSFIGYGTDLHIYYKGNPGSSLTLSTSSVSTGESRNIIDGEIYDHTFYVPYSSPTVIRYTLVAGSTLHLTIGGLKK